ncbi:MAG TPA: hypothetical protein VJ743_23125 [Albitalea sp.]|nr:hypothetical protein [Albitalea sp.]
MGTPADKAKGGTVQGEGDYEAGRRFDKAEGEFVKSGQARQRSGQATPRDAAEAADMDEAERQGRSHSKGEAPGDLSSGQKAPKQPKPRK